jgi:superfamily I DNA/RNA helicase
MTRAKKKLVVSYADARMQQFRGGKINFAKTKPSRFLHESGLIQNVKIIKNK